MLKPEQVISWYDKLTWHDIEEIAKSKVKDSYVSSQEVDFFILGMEEVIRKIKGADDVKFFRDKNQQGALKWQEKE